MSEKECLTCKNLFKFNCRCYCLVKLYWVKDCPGWSEKEDESDD